MSRVETGGKHLCNDLAGIRKIVISPQEHYGHIALFDSLDSAQTFDQGRVEKLRSRIGGESDKVYRRARGRCLRGGRLGIITRLGAGQDNVAIAISNGLFDHECCAEAQFVDAILDVFSIGSVGVYSDPDFFVLPSGLL